jgi:uncharacterized integral membrane protein (TIGR00698 family)
MAAARRTSRPRVEVTRPARVVPGLVVVAAGAGVAWSVNRLVPAISALTVAVVLGVAVGAALPAATRDGLRWGTTRFLRLGVVLLGLQLSVASVTDLGIGTVAAVVVTVVLAFAAILLLGRAVGVSRGLALMVATGFSICGAAAIAAMDSVTRTDRRDVATGITLVTLYGTVAIALVPIVGVSLGMSDRDLGNWAGLSVHEVAQVVAAASPAGAAAIAGAVVVKLTRVLLLAPMVAGVGLWERRRGTRTGPRPPVVPLFVLGFLAMIALRSTGAVPAGALDVARAATTVLLAAALFGLGTAVRIPDLLRTGRRGLVLGAVATVLVALVALAALALTGAGR